MPDWNRSYAHFRLNFEQQGKRAKDLLKAARAGEPEALARFLRSPGEGKARAPWTDVFAITDLGRAVLRGEVDFRSLKPPPRWVGGVQVASGNVDWRWDEQLQDAIESQP